MGRTPCCEEMGLKKGPWTPEEDFILTSYIHQHGHGNWRALPRLAGLLRCGKSCRLRWVNYLRPDVKRGNFTEEEEDTIIKLHGALGNRWSAIAAKLPGRTDNEIKNFWHTHLKKRSCEQHPPPTAAPRKNVRTGIRRSICGDKSVQVPFPLSPTDEQQQLFQHQPRETSNLGEDTNWQAVSLSHDHSKDEYMEFWYSLFVKAGDQAGKVMPSVPMT